MGVKKDHKILRRKIYDGLLHWKSKSNGSTALMIDGARRVGKSFICEKFAENELKNMDIINERLSLASSLREDKEAELDQLVDGILASMKE